MRTYNPDKWVILEVTSDAGVKAHKVFASWYGGFANGDSWKLSSGVVGAKNEDGVFGIENYSGSIYVGSKSNYGMSTYSMSVLASWTDEAPEGAIRVLEENEAIKYLESL